MDSIDFAKNVYEKITAAAIDDQAIIFFIFFEILIIPIAHEIIPEIKEYEASSDEKIANKNDFLL